MLEVSAGCLTHVALLVLPLEVTRRAGGCPEPAVLVVLVRGAAQLESLPRGDRETAVRDLHIEAVDSHH